MSRPLVGKINVNKIDKAKLFVGKKGTYLDVIIWINDEEDNYGNVASIQQTLSKEERDAGSPKIFLGNLADLPGNKPAPAAAAAEETAEGDLPF